MNNSNRHKISVYGFNGSIDAMQSSIIKIDKIYIEKDSPAASQKIISELISKNKFNYEVLHKSPRGGSILSRYIDLTGFKKNYILKNLNRTIS